MSILDNLEDTQKERIISLPYRVGVWVSRSDAAGGEEAQARELQVLTNILAAFEEEVFSSEEIQHLMRQTMAHKEDWARWSANMAAIPSDCSFALGHFRQYAGQKEADALKVYLMHIAEAVALAFSEHETTGVTQKLKSYFSYLFARLRALRVGIHGDSLQQFLRISPRERMALRALAKALQSTYI